MNYTTIEYNKVKNNRFCSRFIKFVVSFIVSNDKTGLPYGDGNLPETSLSPPLPSPPENPLRVFSSGNFWGFWRRKRWCQVFESRSTPTFRQRPYVASPELVKCSDRKHLASYRKRDDTRRLVIKSCSQFLPEVARLDWTPQFVTSISLSASNEVLENPAPVMYLS